MRVLPQKWRMERERFEGVNSCPMDVGSEAALSVGVINMKAPPSVVGGRLDTF